VPRRPRWRKSDPPPRVDSGPGVRAGSRPATGFARSTGRRTSRSGDRIPCYSADVIGNGPLGVLDHQLADQAATGRGRIDVARRIGGPGGGSDPGSKGGGTVLAVVGLALALAAGGTSAVGGAVGSGTSASAGSLSSARGQARVSTRSSQAAEARLAARGVRLTARAIDDTDDCVEHSYGQVREFLRRNPCVALHRTQFELRDRNGDVVLLAISWIEFADEATARRFHQLVDTHGTGNVTELSRERGRYRSVRYTGDIYASHRDGATVSNAQAQPVARGGAGLALTSIVTHAIR
jgi:hypothetical protein